MVWEDKVTQKEAEQWINSENISTLIDKSYLHFHEATATYGIKLADNLISINNVIKEYKKKTKFLIKTLREKEIKFMSLFNIKKRKDLVEFLNQLQPIQMMINLKGLSKEWSKLRKGWKSEDEIQNIITIYNRLIEAIDEYSLKGKELEEVETLIAEYKSNAQKIKNKELKEAPGLSKRVGFVKIWGPLMEIISNDIASSLNSNNVLENVIFDKIDVSKDTKTGSSADTVLSIKNKNDNNILFTIPISVKTSGAVLQQNKSRLFQTFFTDIKYNNIKPNKLRNMVNTISFEKNRGIDIVRYIISNYSLQEGLKEDSIKNFYLLLIISSVNEKIFGFNKTQQTKDLDILNKIPIFSTSTSGVHLLSELLERIIYQIEQDFNNIFKLQRNVSISKNTSYLKELNAKREKIKRKIRKKSESITYDTLIEYGLIKEILSLQEKIMNSNKISIQYAIPYDI